MDAPPTRRIAQALWKHRRELAFAALILAFLGVREARENALLRAAITVPPDKEVTLLSTSW